MWYRAEATAEPTLVDSTSSKRWVYVRKNVTAEQRTDEFTGETYTVWVFDEAKIPKDIYTIFEQQASDQARIADIEEVITEIIGGGLV